MGRRTPSLSWSLGTMVVSYRARGHLGMGREATGGNPRADLGCGMSSPPHRRPGTQRPRSGRPGPDGARRPYPQDGQAAAARVRVPGRVQVLHPGPAQGAVLAKTRPAAAAPRSRQGWPGWPLGTSQPRGRGAGGLVGPLPALAQSPDVHRPGEAWCGELPLGMIVRGGPCVHGGAAASPTGASCAAAGQQGAPTPGRPTSCRPVPEAQVPAVARTLAGTATNHQAASGPGDPVPRAPPAADPAPVQRGCPAGSPRPYRVVLARRGGRWDKRGEPLQCDLLRNIFYELFEG